MVLFKAGLICKCAVCSLIKLDDQCTIVTEPRMDGAHVSNRDS